MNRLEKALNNIVYSQTGENKTSLQRKVERIAHDPVRYYDASDEKVSKNFPVIKAVRLG